jgi:hypothetical protein
MWNSDGRRLPDWVEDAYDHLAPRILESDGGIPRDDAVTFLADHDDLALEVSESKFAIEQLLDRGYLYEVEGVLFVTDADLKQVDSSDDIA